MAAPQAQQETPTFKLVLVGDGGTGKVNRTQEQSSEFLFPSRSTARMLSCRTTPLPDEGHRANPQFFFFADHFRQASCDG